jgi:hypothetical protein
MAIEISYFICLPVQGGCLCTGSGVWGETDYMFALVEM